MASTSEREAPFLVGKTWDGGFTLADPTFIEAYAAATNDNSSLYYGPGAVAPPMFHVRCMRDLLFAVMQDPELDLDFLRLLHGEHDATFHRPIRSWEVVNLRGRLEQVEQKAKGLLVVARMYGFASGELVVEARSSFFIRGQIVSDVGRGRVERPTVDMPAGPPAATLPWRVDDDQSHRYAAASLDDNPLHTDPETARSAGLPNVILHGLCTMARAGQSIVRAYADDDSRTLRRLAVRFASPVYNGEELNTRVWYGDGDLRFDVVRADGTPVITHGIAELQ